MDVIQGILEFLGKGIAIFLGSVVGLFAFALIIRTNERISRRRTEEEERRKRAEEDSRQCREQERQEAPTLYEDVRTNAVEQFIANGDCESILMSEWRRKNLSNPESTFRRANQKAIDMTRRLHRHALDCREHEITFASYQAVIEAERIMKACEDCLRQLDTPGPMVCLALHSTSEDEEPDIQFREAEAS